MSGLEPILVLLSLVVVVALILPLISSASRERRVSRGPSELDALLRKKAMLYSNMKDLEFEYQMGKLSEADYARLRDEDRAEAGRILQEIDRLEDRGDVDAIIEREIAAREAGASSPAASKSSPAASGSSPAASSAPRPEPAKFCSACGKPVQAGDRFCAQCGHQLLAGERA